MRTRPLDVASTDIGIVVFERLDHVLDRQTEAGKTFGKRRYDILLAVAADRVDLGDPWNRAKLWPNHPVMQRPQILRGIARPIGFDRALLGLDRVHEDLAQARGDRPELGFDRLRQVRTYRLQALVDELPGEVDVGAVLENDGDLAQTVARNRARIGQPRQPRDGGFDRIGNALLGFERREARRRSVDLHLHIGDVRHGIDLESAEAVNAHGGENEHRCQHCETLSDRQLDNSFQHEIALLSDRGSRPTSRCRP